MQVTSFQRDNYIDALMRTDALLEYAVEHGMAEEADRLREKLRQLAAMGEPVPKCKPVWDGRN